MYSKPRSQFATNLIAIRKKKGVSQRDLAQLSGLSGRMIAYYETNTVIPPLEKLEKLAAALNCSVAELVDQNLVPKSASELNTRTLKKIQIIEQLPLEDQKKVMAYAHDLLEKNLFKNGRATPSRQELAPHMEAAEGPSSFTGR